MVSKLKASKRGMVAEFLYAVVFVIVFVLVTVFSIIAYKGVNADIQSDQDMLNQTKETAQAFETSFQSWVDYVILLLFAGLWLVGLAAAYVHPGHPILAVILFVIVILVMIVGAIISNVWEDIKNESEDVDLVVAILPITDYILSSYLLFVGVMGFSIIIVFALRQYYG